MNILHNKITGIVRYSAKNPGIFNNPNFFDQGDETSVFS